MPAERPGRESDVSNPVFVSAAHQLGVTFSVLSDGDRKNFGLPKIYYDSQLQRHSNISELF